MKLEYQAIMWLFMLLLPIIAFTVYGVLNDISFETSYSYAKVLGKNYPFNGYAFIMMTVVGLWVVRISFIMFNDETQTTLINNEEITKMV